MPLPHRCCCPPTACQASPPPTPQVLGTVKNALVVVLGIALLSESVAPLQGVGYCISIGAFFVYQRLKMRQIAAESGGGAKPAAASGGGGASITATGSIMGSMGSLPRYASLPQSDSEQLAPGAAAKS